MDGDDVLNSIIISEPWRFKWLEYVKNSGFFDIVELEYCPITYTSEFTLQKGDFHMKHRMRTPWSATDSRIQLEIDEMINRFITSPLNRTSTRYDGFYAKALADTIAMGDTTLKNYIKEDINMTKQIVNSVYGDSSRKLEIKNVCFNDPLTVVIWSDGSKTFVKAHDEPYDPEKGLAMAITKKFFGNKYNYSEQFKKWIK